MQVGIIGAGGKLGKPYLNICNKLEKELDIKLQLQAFSRTNEKNIAETKEWLAGQGILGVKGYDNWEKMLHDEALDALIINSPTPYHYDHLKAAIEKAIEKETIKSIFCEKPLVLYDEHKKAKELIEKAAQKEILIGMDAPMKVVDSELIKTSFDGIPYLKIKSLKFDITWITVKKDINIDEILEDLWIYPYYVTRIEPKGFIRKDEKRIGILASNGISSGIIILGYDGQEKREWTFYDKKYYFNFSYGWDKSKKVVTVDCSINGRKAKQIAIQNPLEISLKEFFKNKPLVTGNEAIKMIEALGPLKND